MIRTKAKYAGHCRFCGLLFGPGTDIARVHWAGRDRWFHSKCATLHAEIGDPDNGDSESYLMTGLTSDDFPWD